MAVRVTYHRLITRYHGGSIVVLYKGIMRVRININHKSSTLKKKRKKRGRGRQKPGKALART